MHVEYCKNFTNRGGEILNNKSWYAMFVRTGDEDNVKERIEYRLKEKFAVFVPKRRLKERKSGIWYEKVRTMFPGYVLVKGDMTVNDYYEFKEIPGVLNMLKSETRVLKIRNNEVEIISKLKKKGETLGFSKAFIEKDRVEILDGPLKSMEGLIVSINKRKSRAKVKINFMNEQRTIDLGLTLLKLANV